MDRVLSSTVRPPPLKTCFVVEASITEMRIMASSNKLRAAAREPVYTSLPSFAYPSFSTSARKRIRAVRIHRTILSLSNAKKANLSAARKERIKLPNYDCECGGKAFHISEFLNHPPGIQAVLNTSALQSLEFLDTNRYRCTLPKVQLLNFEVAPVMDLQVTPTNEDCTVQLLSCKFEGSDFLERQNDHFSAFMVNHITWATNDSESFLEVDVKLNLSLEVYTRPFTLLPLSAIEGPGNLNVVTYRMMQALVDRLVPLLLQQLLQGYIKWVHQKLEDFS